MKAKTSISGIVRHGQNRGKALGFPTINIGLEKTIEEGIYLSHILIAGKQYNALTFIGTAKTFDEETYQSETYVLDFNENVYGKEVSVTLLKKLRENKKFISIETLVAQMEQDKLQAKAFFKTLPV